MIIQLLKTDARFAAQDCRHWELGQKALVEAVIVKGEEREGELPAQQDGSDSGDLQTWVYMTLEFASATLTPEEADQVMLVITTAIWTFNQDFLDNFQANFPDLMVFSIDNDSNTNRIDTRKLRKRVLTFRCLGKLNL